MTPKIEPSRRRPLQLDPAPLDVPKRLLDAFDFLGVKPILVGGMAVQVWSGRKDGPFVTHDLDFIASISLRDLAQAGISMERGGRHAVVDGIPVEFPSGPLAVGDLLLSPELDTVSIPTLSGGQILIIRPEACVLDRLAWVAGGKLAAAYHQAIGVALAQIHQPGWDSSWVNKAAMKAGLGKQWKNLHADIQQIEAHHPNPDALLKALNLGWG